MIHNPFNTGFHVRFRESYFLAYVAEIRYCSCSAAAGSAGQTGWIATNEFGPNLFGAN